MRPQFADACRVATLPRPFLGFRPHRHILPPPTRPPLASSRVSCASSGGRRPRGGKRAEGTATKPKDNVWSIDNELAAAAPAEERGRGRRGRGRRGRGRGKGTDARRGQKSSTVLVSTAMLMEIETVLQAQEPVIKASWDTFASSVSGIWNGVGAVFSPSTAEMEPVGVGKQNENLYDCYTVSCIEKVASEGLHPQIRRKVNWVHFNPLGETRKHRRRVYSGKDTDESVPEKRSSDLVDTGLSLPGYGSFDFGKSEVLEEDFMCMEPGLVFFEDGSYSRGPFDIPVKDFDESNYFLSPTFKFEQCLVKGCHKRLRIVHTIEFGDGGSSIQIVRVAIYEEQWVSPVNLYSGNDDDTSDLKPISQQRRAHPSDLTGSWKVFEVSAMPIYSEEMTTDGPPFVYLCTETLKKRSLPESSSYFGEEEMLDMQDATVIWLPGGVTGYVDVNKDGTLCIGFGWYSDDGINLVMERDYGTDGKLKEVRSKTEVKRRWTDSSSQ